MTGQDDSFRTPDGSGPAIYRYIRSRPGYFRLLSQFRYNRKGMAPDQGFVVPADMTTFESDLASIPIFATWLVPRDGTHTPAALLHDALSRDKETKRSVIGPLVGRAEADEIFRRALKELGVPFLRRWMMWAAVRIGGLWTTGRMRSRVWYVVISIVTLGGSAVLSFGILGSLLFRSNRILEWFMDDLPFIPIPLWLVVAASIVLWLGWAHVGLIAAGPTVIFGAPLALAGMGFLIYLVLEAMVYRAVGDNPPIIFRNPVP
jgi:hypothetical protein